MVVKMIAPHGDWVSPITSDTIAYEVRSIVSPRVSSATGRKFYTESDHTGRKTIMEVTSKGIVDLLPTEYSVGNTVYEYGATTLDTLNDGRIIFSNSDNTVRILDPDTRKVSLLVQSPVLRYAAFHAHCSSPWVLAIEEDHTNDTPYEIQNYIVAIHVETGQVKRVVTGSDFYFLPHFSIDGTRLSWLEWDHPEMLFDSSKVCCADWDPNGSVSNKKIIAGQNDECAAESRWGRDGSFFFSREVKGYRQLFRIKPGQTEPEHIKLRGLEEAEIGEGMLFEGSRTYMPLSDHHLIAIATHNGISVVVSIDVETKEWKEVAKDEGICSAKWDAIARIDDTSALVIGASRDRVACLYRIDIQDPSKNKLLRTTCDKTYPSGLITVPETVCIPSKSSPSRKIHGFLYMPANDKYCAKEGELPPLIINAHGGPTGAASCALSLRTNYFTSRGYACLWVNYTGSTGYGDDYRRLLYGRWGITDADDVAEYADYLTNQGRVRPGAVGITGLSAGGYNTLQSAVQHPTTFAGGFCVSGISDLETFDGSTHKLESDYTSALVLPNRTDTPDDERLKLYRERSALHHVDVIKTPLFILHGQEDTVVPLEQARFIANAVKKNGGDITLVEVPGDGHVLGLPTSVKLWLEEEEKWWRRTLLRV